ncbi:regulator component [Streptomyces sp. DSM 44917]|uniref:Regulator component n=1 Tax=Streptomyces boetiae TaxID=3075541 RepID=A0ABU2LFY5_9ACTN|nr:regulator component [Streptomyces sp. DSM 44917]MDT0310452.1 regulator component [Streptomyces sp. DSM 44917]
MTTTSEYAQLHSRCRKILDDLGVPKPYSLTSTVRWTEGLRGRRLVLKELPQQAASAGACGLWVGTDDADFVFYETRTAPLHREHIILHEIGHMLAGHPNTPLGEVGSEHQDDGPGGAHDQRAGDNGLDGALESLLSGLQPHLIKRLMARTSYTTVEEQEAEMLASLMRGSHKPPPAAGALGRLGALLGVRADDRH